MSKKVVTPKVVIPMDINTILNYKHRLKCKNQVQKEFAKLIVDNEIIIASGPAGVGKSYVAIAKAIELVQTKANKFEKIMIITPAVEAGENLGFLPGDMKEKLAPHVASSIDIIDKIVKKPNRKKLSEAGILKIDALAFIRGKSIDNTILVMEEAQNMSPDQMKTLLTRIGYNSKFIISGDLDQSDRFKHISKSGLYDAIDRHKNVNAIGFVEFQEIDIVRNPLIKEILANYRDTAFNKPKQERPRTTTTLNDLKPKKKKGNWSWGRIKAFIKVKFSW